MSSLRVLLDIRGHYSLIEVWIGCSNGYVSIQNNNDIKMNKRNSLQWKQYIATMLVLHMKTRTHHEVNYSDRSVCGIGMMITGSLSQVLDDTKRVSEVIPIGMIINDAGYMEG